MHGELGQSPAIVGRQHDDNDCRCQASSWGEWLVMTQPVHQGVTKSRLTNEGTKTEGGEEDIEPPEPPERDAAGGMSRIIRAFLLRLFGRWRRAEARTGI